MNQESHSISVPLFAARLKASREALRMKQDDVAIAVGVHRVTVNKWEGEKSCPTWGNIEALVKVLKVDQAWLAGITADQDDPDPWVPIPHYAGYAAAGEGFAEDDRMDGFTQFKRSWLRTITPRFSSVVAVDVIGDSMEPTLRSGDWVLVDIAAKRPSGLSLINFGGGIAIKRLTTDLSGTQLTVASDNPVHPTVVVDIDDESRVPNILGRVIFVGRRI